MRSYETAHSFAPNALPSSDILESFDFSQVQRERIERKRKAAEANRNRYDVPAREQKAKEREKYRITKMEYPLYPPPGDENHAYIFHTKNKGMWKIYPPLQQYDLGQPSTRSDRQIVRRMLSKERIIRSKVDHEITHDHILDFFYQNWDDLVQMFYTSRLENHGELLRVSEAHVRTNSRDLDLLALGPDSKSFLFEAGKGIYTEDGRVFCKGKNGQIYAQIDGLDRLSQQHNHPILRSDNIYPSILSYVHKPEDRLTIVTVQSPVPRESLSLPSSRSRETAA